MLECARLRILMHGRCWKRVGSRWLRQVQTDSATSPRRVHSTSSPTLVTTTSLFWKPRPLATTAWNQRWRTWWKPRLVWKYVSCVEVLCHTINWWPLCRAWLPSQPLPSWTLTLPTPLKHRSPPDNCCVTMLPMSLPIYWRTPPKTPHPTRPRSLATYPPALLWTLAVRPRPYSTMHLRIAICVRVATRWWPLRVCSPRYGGQRQCKGPRQYSSPSCSPT
mmetsp:Transcript_74763/g.175509  ORF Transcript_74763/g.175509 Transcript_74763/m.175509 type:complete len:220 (+) Transcript_74763:345-1004(+)